MSEHSFIPRKPTYLNFGDLDYQTALRQLMAFFVTLAGATNKAGKQTVLCQLQQRIADLP